MIVVGGSGVCMSKIGKSKSTMDDIAPITADDEREKERNAKMQDSGTRKKRATWSYYILSVLRRSRAVGLDSKRSPESRQG